MSVLLQLMGNMSAVVVLFIFGQMGGCWGAPMQSGDHIMDEAIAGAIALCVLCVGSAVATFLEECTNKVNATVFNVGFTLLMTFVEWNHLWANDSFVVDVCEGVGILSTVVSVVKCIHEYAKEDSAQGKKPKYKRLASHY